jgi:hypothetical protein
MEPIARLGGFHWIWILAGNRLADQVVGFKACSGYLS